MCSSCLLSIGQLEAVCVQWEHFNSQSEVLSSWISEKEKDLEAVNPSLSSSSSSFASPSDHLVKHMSTVEVWEISSGFFTVFPRENLVQWAVIQCVDSALSVPMQQGLYALL